MGTRCRTTHWRTECGGQQGDEQRMCVPTKLVHARDVTACGAPADVRRDAAGRQALGEHVKEAREQAHGHPQHVDGRRLGRSRSLCGDDTRKEELVVDLGGLPDGVESLGHHRDKHIDQ